MLIQMWYEKSPPQDPQYDHLQILASKLQQIIKLKMLLKSQLLVLDEKFPIYSKDQYYHWS